MTIEETLRDHARRCFGAALAAVDPGRLVRESLHTDGNPVPPDGPVRVMAVGKAAPAMADAAWAALRDRIVEGVVIAPAPWPDPPPRARGFVGGHPIPNAESERAARAALDLAQGLGPNDTLVCLISGGGSALMTLPVPGVSLDDLCRTTHALLEAGAAIHELNTVRKHLDLVKGGRLARAAAPARVVALIVSDVLGDRLDVIASGPVTPDPTTYADAITVLRHRGVYGVVPSPVRDHLAAGARGEYPDTPDAEELRSVRIDTRIIGRLRMAAAAAAAEATRLGYHTLVTNTDLSGEARQVGRDLGSLVRTVRAGSHPVHPPACLVAGGETTVTVTGTGRGGRNQELVLGAAMELDGGAPALVASMGTDGIDGMSHAAGAWADQTTIRRAEARGLDANETFRRNDSTTLFEALNDLLVTGPTGTNVMDLQLVFVPAVPNG